MHLLSTYVAFNRGDINEFEYATALGTSVTNLRHRLTLWGPRIALLFSTLDAIAAGTVSRKDAAQTLQVSERQVNKLMDTWNVRRPISDYSVKREAPQLKWLVRRNAAIDFIEGKRDILKAAADAGIGERQMRRWVSQLLSEHFGDMTWGDLVELDPMDPKKGRENQAKRERLANEIRTALSIKDNTEALARKLSNGTKPARKKAIEAVLIQQVVERRLGVA